VSLATHESDCY